LYGQNISSLKKIQEALQQQAELEESTEIWKKSLLAHGRTGDRQRGTRAEVAEQRKNRRADGAI
jgi:hypothetical protein